MSGTAFSTIYTELGARLSDAAHSVWTLAQKKRFINAAIRNANEQGAYRVVIDATTLDAIADTFEYSLPSGIAKAGDLLSVWLQDDTADQYEQAGSWWVQETRGYTSGVEAVTLKLELPHTLEMATGNAIKLEYLAEHQELSADTDTTSLPVEYLYAYGQFMAHSETRTFADVDRKYHENEAQKYFQVADKYLRRYLNQLPSVGGRIIPTTWSISY